MGAIVALRIVHIGLGVFWVGAVLLLNFVVGPAIAATGPDGMRVLQELNRRHYFDILLGAAVLTILAGVDLMRRDSAGFAPAWFKSSFGMAISAGMIAAVIAFLAGVLLIRPAITRMAALGAEMVRASTPEGRAAIAPRMAAIQGRVKAAGSVSALFLIIAVLAMATARYL